ncbi:ComEC family competence protein [bacterium]|nr:ComEC family competence protein [bacterium]
MSRKYPALGLLAAVTSGLVIADLTGLPSWLWLTVAFALSVLGAVRLNTRLGVALLLASLAAVSGFHFALSYQHGGARHLEHLISPDRVFTICGRVADWPAVLAERTDITLDIDSLVDNRSYPVDGSILLRVTARTTTLQRGDRIAFCARIYPIEQQNTTGPLNYNRYLRLHGISGVAYLPTLLNVTIDRRSSVSYFPFVDAVRGYIVACFTTDLSPTTAALAKGYLLGETRDIPIDIYTMFRDSGTLHVLAVSGSNVALVILVCHLLMRPLGWTRGRRYAVLLGVVAVYAGLCYFEPSVMRASLMAALVILAKSVRRKVDLNQIVALTASIILIIDPAQFFDIGFQLSFATAWGLIFIVPRITVLLEKHHSRVWYRWLVFPLIVSLVAQVVSTPLVAFYFERLPLLSVPANLIIVPLVSIGVMGITVLPLIHLVWPILGQFAGSLVDPLLRLSITVLHWFGGEQLPVITITGLLRPPWSHFTVIAAYVLIILAALALSSKPLRRSLVFATLSLAVVGATTGAIVNLHAQHTRVWVERLPGGVLVLAHDNSGTGDLVITSVIDRNYPVDERIILPILKRQSVDRLRTIVVLDLPYNAADDVLRLATATRARRLLVPRSLSATFADVLAADSADCTFELDSFSGRPPFPDSPGWAVGEGEVHFRQADILVTIVDQVRQHHLESAVSGGSILIVGRTWSPSPDDWIRLHWAGYQLMVASSVRRHPVESAGADGVIEDEGAPLYLYDLKKLGPLELPFE